jgi:hypothetical protein
VLPIEAKSTQGANIRRVWYFPRRDGPLEATRSAANAVLVQVGQLTVAATAAAEGVQALETELRRAQGDVVQVLFNLLALFFGSILGPGW